MAIPKASLSTKLPAPTRSSGSQWGAKMRRRLLPLRMSQTVVFEMPYSRAMADGDWSEVNTSQEGFRPLTNVRRRSSGRHTGCWLRGPRPRQPADAVTGTPQRGPLTRMWPISRSGAWLLELWPSRNQRQHRQVRNLLDNQRQKLERRWIAIGATGGAATRTCGVRGRTLDRIGRDDVASLIEQVTGGKSLPQARQQRR
jgi:hypothetical protein